MTGPTLLDLDRLAAGAKALTVRQPWAWAIAHGGKAVENRATNWHYRGPLLIHAGSAWGADFPEYDPRLVAAWYRVNPDGFDPGPLPRPERVAGLLVHSSDRPGVPTRGRIEFGVIAAVADLVDVHEAGTCTDEGGPCYPWGENSYVDADTRKRTRVTHLVLDAVEPLIGATVAHNAGALGLVDPPADLLADVVDHLRFQRAHPDRVDL